MIIPGDSRRLAFQKSHVSQAQLAGVHDPGGGLSSAPPRSLLLHQIFFDGSVIQTRILGHCSGLKKKSVGPTTFQYLQKPRRISGELSQTPNRIWKNGSGNRSVENQEIITLQDISLPPRYDPWIMLWDNIRRRRRQIVLHTRGQYQNIMSWPSPLSIFIWRICSNRSLAIIADPLLRSCRVMPTLFNSSNNITDVIITFGDSRYARLWLLGEGGWKHVSRSLIPSEPTQSP